MGKRSLSFDLILSLTAEERKGLQGQSGLKRDTSISGRGFFNIDSTTIEERLFTSLTVAREDAIGVKGSKKG
jgi:hypothetical protein